MALMIFLFSQGEIISASFVSENAMATINVKLPAVRNVRIAVVCSKVRLPKYMPPAHKMNSEAFTKGVIHIENVTNH